MSIETLEDLFFHELDAVYGAEQTARRTLQDLINETQDESIVDTLRQHAHETQEHIDRLEEIFNELDRDPTEEGSQGVQGIIRERQEIKRENPPEDALNLINVATAKMIEHYEINAYDNLTLLANRLDMQDAQETLQRNRNEEQEQLDRLNKLAEGYDIDIELL